MAWSLVGRWVRVRTRSLPKVCSYPNAYSGVVEKLGVHTMPIVPAPHGPGSRRVKLSLMQRMLRWGPRLADETLPDARRPAMRFVGPECPYLVGSLPILPYSQKPGSRDDVDTDGDDHGYDAVCNILVSEYGQADKPVVIIEPNRHPGLIPGTAIRRSRVRSPENEAEEERLAMENAGIVVGGRYR